MKRKLLTLLALFTSGVASLTANEISTGTNFKAQPFDVQEYTVDARIDNPASKYIEGSCQMSVKLSHASQDDKFFFHLFELGMDSCFISGNYVVPVQSTDSLGVQYYYIPVGQYTDDVIKVKVYYSGIMQAEPGTNPWGGIHFQDSVLFNMGVGFKNANVSAAAYWFPCYDHPSDKAQYRINLTVPEAYQVALSGHPYGDGVVSNGKRIVNAISEVPAATYMIGMAIGKFQKFTIEGSEIPIEVYTPENKLQDCQKGLKLVPKMIECFENVWGEYPFEKVGYVLTAIGSMEHQSMIALAQGAVSESDTISTTAAHELAHSWFGGSLTPLDFRSAWLNEAFATYSEAIWYDYVKGNNQYYRKIKDNAAAYHNYSETEGVFALHDFIRTGNSSNYPWTIYYKGAAVVHQLRRELGDTLFFGAIQNYIKTYRGKCVTTELFKKSLEDYSKKDLTEFFDMWIYNYGYPLVNVFLGIKLIPNTDGMTKINVKTEQIQAASWGLYKDFTYEINFKLPNGDYFNKYIVINSKEQTVLIDSIPKFTSIGTNLGKVSASLIKLNSKDMASAPNANYVSSEAVSIYPNPTSEQILNINFAIGINNRIEFSVIDLSGNIVKYVSLNTVNDNAKSFQLDLNGIPAGTYILNSKNEDLNIDTKFQIVK